LVVDVPSGVPPGRTILTYTPAAETEETAYTILSKEKAVSMATEVIERYRPALEELAK
jgi:hypothetical protein